MRHDSIMTPNQQKSVLFQNSKLFSNIKQKLILVMFKGGYLDFSHLTEFKNIQWSSVITKSAGSMDSTRVISGVKDITRVDPPLSAGSKPPPHFRGWPVSPKLLLESLNLSSSFIHPLIVESRIPVSLLTLACVSPFLILSMIWSFSAIVYAFLFWDIINKVRYKSRNNSNVR